MYRTIIWLIAATSQTITMNSVMALFEISDFLIATQKLWKGLAKCPISYPEFTNSRKLLSGYSLRH